MSADRARTLIARLHPRRQPAEHLFASGIALLAGIAVFVLATELFPHHSANHDEGVYLQQAAMLLDGRLVLDAGPIADAVRPWFFVQEGGRLYPKYQPYPAALFAIPMALFGAPRLALAAVAAGNVLLVYALGSQAFDRRVGVVAAAAFATAPMTLLTSSVFLPYAPTTLLTLSFAALYLRAYRTGSARAGALAGAAIGLAFFARPYTAVLFVAPFVVHACWQLVGALQHVDRSDVVGEAPLGDLPDPLRRNGATAAVGLGFVGLTLAYNAVVTGHPLRFPFTAFAPRDGPGFGHREIVGHGIEYTPALALEANAHVLWALFTRWGPAGPVGTLLAVVGIGIATRRWRSGAEADGSDGSSSARDVEQTAQQLLAALLLTVSAGNVAFWGNYNVLGEFSDPTDGLLGLFGPFYHFDLLAPLSIFAAAGLVGAWRWLREYEPDDADRSSDGRHPSDHRPDAISASSLRAVGLAIAILLAALGGAASASLVQGPADRHAEQTAYYDAAYEPVEDREFDDAVVFVPTPYGDWLNHPFQSLRNDGGLDGDAVYALDRHTASDFAVLDATGDRTAYRYTYRGEWTPGGERVIPRLQRLDVRSGERLAGETVVGVPDRVERATVRLETGPGEVATYRVREPGESISVAWSLDETGARLHPPNATDGDAEPADRGGAGDREPLAVEEYDEVALQVRLVAADGSTLTYRQEADVRRTADSVAAIWPPERTVCTLVDDCGLEGTYLPDRPEEHVEAVSFETRLRAG